MADHTSVIDETHPLAPKLAEIGRDSTGQFYRLGWEGEHLDKHGETLKAEFDRIDELTEDEMLTEYGFSIANGDDMIRIKGSTVKDKYVKMPDGNYEHWQVQMSVGPAGESLQEWIRIPHHYEGQRWDDAASSWVAILPGDDHPKDTPTRAVANYVWPRERIRLTYGNALKERARLAAEANAG